MIVFRKNVLDLKLLYSLESLEKNNNKNSTFRMWRKKYASQFKTMWVLLNVSAPKGLKGFFDIYRKMRVSVLAGSHVGVLSIEGENMGRSRRYYYRGDKPGNRGISGPKNECGNLYYVGRGASKDQVKNKSIGIRATTKKNIKETKLSYLTYNTKYNGVEPETETA